MNDLLDFSGKKILISGASSGMGAETARLLSSLGASIILVARREGLLKNVVDSLNGDGHRYYAADLGEIDKIEPLIERICEENGKLDGFVNCAGIGEIRPLKQANYSFMLRVMDVNFFSFIEQMRCLLRKTRISPGFCVVTISSVAALRGARAGTAYSASKGAMNAAVRCLARELGPKGIRINAIVSGYIDTAIANESLKIWTDNPMIQNQVLGMGQPLDIANAVAFLLSDMSRMITGTEFIVDGGSTA